MLPYISEAAPDSPSAPKKTVMTKHAFEPLDASRAQLPTLRPVKNINLIHESIFIVSSFEILHIDKALEEVTTGQDLKCAYDRWVQHGCEETVVRLFHIVETVNFGFGTLEPHLELVLERLKITEVVDGCR